MEYYPDIVYMEYYPDIIKKILPLVRTWMNLEGITLSEINQAETNTLWSHLHVECTKAAFTERE